MAQFLVCTRLTLRVHTLLLPRRRPLVLHAWRWDGGKEQEASRERQLAKQRPRCGFEHVCMIGEASATRYSQHLSCCAVSAPTSFRTLLDRTCAIIRTPVPPPGFSVSSLAPQQ